MSTSHTTPLREQMQAELQLAGLSERTQAAYLRAVRQLADHFVRPPDQLTEAELRSYFLYVKNEKRWAVASLRLAFYGIQFFYRRTVPRDWATLKQLKIPRSKTLHDVLTREEVHRLDRAAGAACVWTPRSSCAASSSTSCRVASRRCATMAT
jgi:integrase